MFDTRMIQENFGGAAKSYDENALLQLQVRRACLLLARRHFPARAQVLDIGCGTGALAHEAKEWRIAGLDISPGMCAFARRHCRVVNADARALPFADESFSGVFSSLMLQWVDERPAAFAEMARVLKPGGIAVLSTLAEGTLHELSEAFSMVDGAPHVSEFAPPHTLIEEAGRAGFLLTLVRQSPVVEYYPDTIAIMRALQSIGATNKASVRRKGLMTPRQFSRLESFYRQRFGRSAGLPVTWQALYLVLKKA